MVIKTASTILVHLYKGHRLQPFSKNNDIFDYSLGIKNVIFNGFTQ